GDYDQDRMLDVGGEEKDGAGEREPGDGQDPARAGQAPGGPRQACREEPRDEVAESASEERDPREQRESVPARGRAVRVLEKGRQPRDVEVPAVAEEE